MTDTSDFLKNQIGLTISIIDKLDLRKAEDKAVLLNCLLSLVILPLEQIKKTNKQKTFSGSFKDILKKLGITPSLFQPIKSCDGCIVYSKKDIYTFISKFRNSIAHQNIKVSQDGKHIIYYNRFYSKCEKCVSKVCAQKGVKCEKANVIDFEIALNYMQIRKLAIYIASSYLKA